MSLIRSIIFYIIFYPISALIAVLIMLSAPLSPDNTRRGAHIWAAWFVWCCRVCLGIKLAVRGRIPNESVIVASKHSSAYETLLTLYLFHHPAVVMKAELRKIPVWGWLAARHGSIFVARNKAGSALKSMIRQARARSAEGRPVFIFPEGTRVPVGQTPPLKAGLYGIYAGLHVPVVPVAHNAGLLWTKGFVKHAGTVTVSFLPEIAADLPREEMEALVHAAINLDPLTAEVRD